VSGGLWCFGEEVDTDSGNIHARTGPYRLSRLLRPRQGPEVGDHGICNGRSVGRLEVERTAPHRTAASRSVLCAEDCTGADERQPPTPKAGHLGGVASQFYLDSGDTSLR
jgi:hypothetical protein